MSPAKSSEERIMLTLTDPGQLAMVLEALSHFDSVRVERQQTKAVEISNLTAAEKGRRFLETSGQWKDRDIDANELRQRAWQRGNSGN